MKKETLIISLYAGPGTGKSTTMAGVFSELKMLDINCEMAPEFAKEKVWEGSLGILKNQIYIFGKQFHTLERLRDKVDVIITDSPLLLSVIYDNTDLPEFKNLVLAVNNKLRMMNFFLKRNKKYNPAGRMQNEEEAKKVDQKILRMLDENKIKYEMIDSGRGAIEAITKKTISELGKDLNVVEINT